MLVLEKIKTSPSARAVSVSIKFSLFSTTSFGPRAREDHVAIHLQDPCGSRPGGWKRRRARQRRASERDVRRSSRRQVLGHRRGCGWTDRAVQAGERVNGIGIDVTSPTGQKSTLFHGGHGGNPSTLLLGSGEYITGIEAHWGEKGDHTRIKYIKFTTSSGNVIQGGNPTKDIGTDTAPANYQLGGFVGTSGGEPDSVGAIWTSITPVA
jgi:hypothetical protein